MKKILLIILVMMTSLAAQNVNVDSTYRSEREYFYRIFDNTLEAMRVSLVPGYADTTLVLFDTTFSVSSAPVRLFSKECTKFNIYNLSSTNIYISYSGDIDKGIPVPPGSAWSAGVLRQTDKIWLRSDGNSKVLLEAWRREY